MFKVGIIGCGRIASTYENDKKAQRYYPYLTHAGTYFKHKKTRIVSAADSDSRRLSAFKKMWGTEALYEDYREMLSEVSLDVISICTPPTERVEMFEHAARAGVKGILCEKPAAKDREELNLLIDIAKKNRIKVNVNCYRQFDPSHRKIRDMIIAGKIGEIQHVHCYYGKGIFNQGTHLISYLLYLFGAPRSITTLSRIRQKGVSEDTYNFVITFKNDLMCSVMAVDYSYFRLFEIDIIGTRGRILIYDEGLKFQFYRAVPNHAESGAKAIIPSRRNFQSTIGKSLFYAVDNLLRSVQGNEKPLFDLRDYREVHDVIETIEESYRAGFKGF